MLNSGQDAYFKKITLSLKNPKFQSKYFNVNEVFLIHILQTEAQGTAVSAYHILLPTNFFISTQFCVSHFKTVKILNKLHFQYVIITSSLTNIFYLNV